MKHSRIALLALFITCAAPAGAQSDATGELGTINFPTSAKGPAQTAFLVGVKALHNFEFDTAAEAFRDAQKADPGFAQAWYNLGLAWSASGNYTWRG